MVSATLGVVAAVIAIAAALVILFDALHRRERRVRITTLRLVIPGLPPSAAGARIAFLADLHEGRLYVTREDLLEAVERAEPDLLLLGGDYSSRGSGDAAIELVGRLSRHATTLAIPGNTDRYYDLDLHALGATLAETGGALLVDEARVARAAGARVQVIGVDRRRGDAMDIDPALSRAAEDVHARIALMHSPAGWRALGQLDAHILLCGHTHGGQIRPPGLEAPVTHLSYPARLAAGLFRYRDDPAPAVDRLIDHWRILARGRRPIEVSAADGPLMYVSRGVGVGIVPRRFLCPPELVVIELVPDEGDEEAVGNDG